MKLKPEKGTTGPLEKEKIAVLLLASRATAALPAQPELLWDLAQGKQPLYARSLSVVWIFVLPLGKSETDASLRQT